MGKIVQFPYRQKAANNLNKQETVNIKNNYPLPTKQQVIAFDKKIIDFLFTSMYTDLKININLEMFDANDVAMVTEAINALLSRVFGEPHPLHSMTHEFFEKTKDDPKLVDDDPEPPKVV